MYTFAAGRDSITYQSQQKWLSHFQEQLKRSFFFFFLATWKQAPIFSCFPPKSRYLAVGHRDQEHAFHTSNPSRPSQGTNLKKKKVCINSGNLC